MSSQSQHKNNYYVISNRNYNHDYSKTKSGKIDMTMSGKFLVKYDNLKIDINKIDSYPSHVDIEILEKYIKKINKTDMNIILGSGANGILQNIIKVLFANNKGNLVTPFYSFGQAEFAVTSFGSITKRVTTTDYNVDLDKMINSIDKETKMVYICNPNNPTGKYIESDKILDFVKKVSVPVIIDESSIEFSLKDSLLKHKELPSNLIVIRTFSKAYGLANLRIGYLACSDSFKEEYLLNTSTNEFSGLSCFTTINVLKEYGKTFNENVKKVNMEKKFLFEELNKIGIECLDSYSNTLMTKTVFDEKFFNNLKKNNISVVPVEDEDGKKHIRIAVQKPEVNREFIKLVKKIYKGELI